MRQYKIFIVFLALFFGAVQLNLIIDGSEFELLNRI